MVKATTEEKNAAKAERKACASKKAGKGRQVGAKRYDKEIVLTVVGELLPTSAVEWKQCSERYQQYSHEPTVRDDVDFKRNWGIKMCDSNKKVTGKSAPSEMIRRAQQINLKMLKKGVYYLLTLQIKVYSLTLFNIVIAVILKLVSLALEEKKI